MKQGKWCEIFNQCKFGKIVLSYDNNVTTK